MPLSERHIKPLPGPDANGRIILASTASSPRRWKFFLLGFCTILLLCLYYFIHLLSPRLLPGLPAPWLQCLETLGLALLWLFSMIPLPLPDFPDRTKLVIDIEGLVFSQWSRTRRMRWDQMRDITIYNRGVAPPLLNISGTNTTIKIAGFGVAPKHLAEYLAKRANSADAWAKVEVIELGLPRVSPPYVSKIGSETH